jgi:hypothetical protein
MNISEITIIELVLIITGDGDLSPYRTFNELRDFFNEFEEINSNKISLTNRKNYTRAQIESINGTSTLYKVFRKALHPKHFNNTQKKYSLIEVVKHLNSFLKYDNCKIVKIDKFYELKDNLAVLPEKEHDIIELIKQGESRTLEFKSSARWNMEESKPDKTMEAIIVKTVAAFLNSEGGTLLIGVANNGKVVGLQHDYKLHKKQPDRDGYEQFLTQLLFRENFGLDLSAQVKFNFHTIEGEEVCEVKISKSPKPIYIINNNKQGQPEEQFWIRSGNSNHQLTISKIYDYCKNRFG